MFLHLRELSLFYHDCDNQPSIFAPPFTFGKIFWTPVGLYALALGLGKNRPLPLKNESLSFYKYSRGGGFSLYPVYVDVPLDRYGLAKNCLT